MKSFDILQPIHFNTLEKYFSKILDLESDFENPREIEQLYPDIYLPFDTGEMLRQLETIFNVIKKLNILSHSLREKSNYKGFLNEFIHIQLSELNKEKKVLDIDDITAYCATRVLMDNVHPEIITDKLRNLNTEEINCILFFQIICNGIAHYILEKMYNPLENGRLF